MKLLTVLVLFISFHFAMGQSILDAPMGNSASGKPLVDFLRELEKEKKVKIYFLEPWLRGISIKQPAGSLSIREEISDLLNNTDIKFYELHKSVIIFIKSPEQLIEYRSKIKSFQNQDVKIQSITFGDVSHLKEKVIISGEVFDSENGTPITGASVICEDLNKGTTTDAGGKFTLEITGGKHIVSVSYVNYINSVFDIHAHDNGTLKVLLQENPTLLDEITISEKSTTTTTQRGIGQVQLYMTDVKKMPALMGEVDVFRQIQKLPGVTTAGEASSGFNVRGGSVDQNLILYDKIPVFNTSHVFGFLSAFNSEVIQSLTFYKGGVPSEYGGRASSVLDIRSKEGDFERWKGSGGIGLITSNIMVHGPLKKNKTSIAVSIRSTYSDWLLRMLKTKYTDLQKSSVAFYDASFRVTHKFSNKTKLSGTLYSSKDKFHLAGDSIYFWNNLLSTLQLNHEITPRMFANFTLGAGYYKYLMRNENPVNGFDLGYNIMYPTMKADFHINKDQSQISFGIHSLYTVFNPGQFIPVNPGASKTTLDRQKSIESSLYGSYSRSVGRHEFDAGIRLTIFSALGPATINVYRAGEPLSEETITGTKEFTNNKIIKTYFRPEPRISYRYNIGANSSFKVGYDRMYQYLHLVSNTTSVTPLDIWLPSGHFFKPQQSDQISLGYFVNTPNKKYEFSFEAFGKKINNLVDFKDGATLIMNKHIETDLLQGRGRAYGIELAASKMVGDKFTGFINYTFSRSLRRFDGQSETETINRGREYPSNFDQPHNFNFNWRLSFPHKIYFTGSFTYKTGRPITTPLGRYTVEHVPIEIFTDRNQFRIPDYHRLDVALVFDGGFKKIKKWRSSMSFSIINVYGRRNAYSIFFQSNPSGVYKSYRLSIIGAALPSVSYSFKF